MVSSLSVSLFGSPGNIVSRSVSAPQRDGAPQRFHRIKERRKKQAGQAAPRHFVAAPTRRGFSLCSIRSKKPKQGLPASPLLRWIKKSLEVIETSRFFRIFRRLWWSTRFEIRTESRLNFLQGQRFRCISICSSQNLRAVRVCSSALRQLLHNHTVISAEAAAVSARIGFSFSRNAVTCAPQRPM